MPRHTISQCVTLACLLEVSAPKPGNVHRGADFDDLTFNDFLARAVAIGPVLAAAQSDGVGLAIHSAVQATREVVATNSNLGMILLLAPLAAVPRDQRLQAGVRQVLADLTVTDSMHLWQGIN